MTEIDTADINEANDVLARILTRLLRVAGDAGQPQEANRLAGQAWSALRRVNPHAAQRINGSMHYLAKLEGDGGVGLADADDVPVLRLTRVQARAGQEADLLRAARRNTEDALAAGALTAEAYQERDGAILVASRWRTRAELDEFLSWHETEAHESMRDYAAGPPQATHHPLAR